MRVLVLGGTNLTGPFFIRRLHSLGHPVTVFHRGEHETELPAGVRHVHGDFANPPQELRALTPDVVVHMWAMNESDAHAFLEFFRGAAGRAVLISSGDVYRAYGRLQRLEPGPPGSIPLTEDSPLRETRYPYRGKTGATTDLELYDKILVEQAFRAQSDIPATILRFPAVYGPNDMHRFGPWLKKMEASAELKIDEAFANWRWTHGFSEDVAHAVLLAITDDRAIGRTYNVGEPNTPTWAERLAELGRVAGWNGRIVPVTSGEIPEAERMLLDFAHHISVTSARIRAELGYAEVVPREEGLRRTISWERGGGAERVGRTAP